jgi:hypothetical protein
VTKLPLFAFHDQWLRSRWSPVATSGSLAALPALSLTDLIGKLACRWSHPPHQPTHSSPHSMASGFQLPGSAGQDDLSWTCWSLMGQLQTISLLADVVFRINRNRKVSAGLRQLLSAALKSMFALSIISLSTHSLAVQSPCQSPCSTPRHCPSPHLISMSSQKTLGPLPSPLLRLQAIFCTFFARPPMAILIGCSPVWQLEAQHDAFALNRTCH